MCSKYSRTRSAIQESSESLRNPYLRLLVEKMEEQATVQVRYTTSVDLQSGRIAILSQPLGGGRGEGEYVRGEKSDCT